MVRTFKKPPKKSKERGQPVPVGHYLVADPAICHGELTFRGTRVPVRTVLLHLAKGHNLAYLCKSWPEVKLEAIEEAIGLAAESLAHQFRHTNP